MVSFQVLPFTWLDGHLVVITELQEEIDWSIAAADHWRFTPYHPVFPSGIWSETGVIRTRFFPSILYVLWQIFTETPHCRKQSYLLSSHMCQVENPTHLGDCRPHRRTPGQKHHKRIGCSPESQWPSCSQWSRAHPSAQWWVCWSASSGTPQTLLQGRKAHEHGKYDYTQQPSCHFTPVLSKED